MYFTVRHYGNPEADDDFIQTLAGLREQCENLLDAYVIEQVLRPLAQAIATS